MTREGAAEEEEEEVPLSEMTELLLALILVEVALLMVEMKEGAVAKERVIKRKRRIGRIHRRRLPRRRIWRVLGEIDCCST